MLGQRWHRIGLCWAILVVFCGFCWPLLGKSWDHIGLVLGHFGLCWDILGHVGTILGSSWAILGSFRICVGLCFGLGHFSVVDFSSMQACAKNTKNIRKNTPKIPGKIQFVDYVADGFCCFFLVVFVSFLGHAAVRLCLPDLGLMLGIVGYVGTFWATLSHFWGILWFLYVAVGFCWARIGTILGSSWAILGHFRICVGLCFGLGHFSVVDFSSMQACAKNTKNIRKNTPKIPGKIQFVDYVADGFCCYFLVVFVSFLGHAAVRLCLPDLGLMLGIVGYVGTFWATLSHFWGILWFLYVSVGFCWARIGTILGSSWAILGSSWAILGHFRICVGLCFGLGHFSVVDFSSMQGVCKKHKKTKETIQFVDYVADGFCCYCLVVFVSFLGHAAVMLGHSGPFSDLFRPLFWTRACQRRWLFVHARRVQKKAKIPGKNTICIPQWISTTKCYGLGPGKWTKTLVWNF